MTELKCPKCGSEDVGGMGDNTILCFDCDYQGREENFEVKEEDEECQ